MKKSNPLNITANRRQVLTGIGAGLLAAPVILSSGRALAADNIVLVTFGGSFADVVKRVIAEPFTAETGIGVTFASGPDLGKAKAQVTTGNIEWDIFDGSGAEMHNAAQQGLFEPLDTSIIDTSGMFAKASEYAMPFLVYAGGLAFDPKRTPKPPKTFAQFFDIENYPGRRGLRTRVSETLELALLADGVKPAELYPLDVERAFASLDKIKPAITKWIDQSPQTISLLTSGEIDYVYTYNGRVATAQMEGLSVEFSTEQSILLTQYYSILKGSPKREQATRYIEFATRPEVQARLSEAYYSIPVRAAALNDVAADVRASLPDPGNPNMVLMQEAFWADKYIDLDRRFKEWLLV